MKVYRVRHKRIKCDGVLAGPYRYVTPLHAELKHAHDGCESHPTPKNDGIVIEADQYCGFESIDDLLEWFDGWIERLAEAGFEIAEYDIPSCHVKKGDYQVVFKMPSRCKRRIPMESLCTRS